MADRSGNCSLFASLTRADRHLLMSILALLCFGIATAAQQPVDDDLAPPPLRLMSQDEKTKLAAEAEVKRRTKLGLLLMDARLKQAETFDTAADYDQMYIELGGFHALMDNMLDFLYKSDKDSNKVLNNFKRFEIGLRGFIVRLEMIRHHLPIRYEHYLRTLVKNIRAARARAIEPLFDDTVVPEKKPVQL